MTVAVNDKDGSALVEAVARLTAAGHLATPWHADVTDSAAVRDMTERVERELGPLWLVVNNAGTFHSAPTEDFPEAAWDQEFAVDAKAAFLCSQAAIRLMLPRRAGRIIVVSSIAGLIVRTRQIAYCAAKAAAIHFARCLAVEMAPHGITVNCICPGMTDSRMVRETASSRGVALEDYLAMIPAGRLAAADDHASCIAWLASDDAAHLTGQVISVDGGQSLYHPVTTKG
jgi:NAD(P)-dependent dehydrogenase (short-subunit alcohol dehydrogenase family)